MFISKERLRNIERHLQDLEDKQFEQGELIEFLIEHNKDDIVASTEFVKGEIFPSRRLFIKYINSNSKLCKLSTSLNTSMEIKHTERVNDDIFILHFEDTDIIEELKCSDKFFQLDKSKEEIIDITDIKARYENQEKVSENLKQSAQALGEAVKDLFGGCKKGECKCKKPNADKTEKQETAPKTRGRKKTNKEEK